MIIIEPNEKIIHKAHRHWFVFTVEVFSVVAFAIAPLIFYFIPGEFLRMFISSIFSIDGNGLVFGLFLYVAWLLICWTAAVLIWTDYYLDVWIITDKRVIAIDQQGMFHRNVSTFRPDMVQDATVKVPGVIATLIKYGNINVQTAGQLEGFSFKGVADPNRLKGYILEQQRLAQESTSPAMQSPFHPLQ